MLFRWPWLFVLLHTCSCLDECGRLNEYDERTGWNALHRAAISLNLKCIKYLLEMGADPNAVTLKGSSALHLVTKHHVDQDVFTAVEFLLEYQANVELKDNGGQEPMQHVYRNKRLMEDTKMALFDIMSEKGSVARELKRPFFNFFGFEVPYLPAIPLRWISEPLDHMISKVEKDESRDPNEAKIEELTKELTKSKLDLAKNREAIKAMRESADLVKKETEEIKTDLASAKSQVRTTSTELKQQTAELERVNAENSDNKDLLNQALEDLASKNAAHAELQIAKTKIDELEAKLAANLNNFAAELATKNTEIETKAELVDALESAKLSLAKESAHKMELESQLELSKAALGDSRKSFEGRIQLLEESAKQRNREHEAHLAQIHELQQSVSSGLELLESCNANLNQIEQTETEQSIEDKPKSIAVDDVAISELESEIERLTKEKRIVVLTGMQAVFASFVVYVLSKCCRRKQHSFDSDMAAENQKILAELMAERTQRETIEAQNKAISENLQLLHKVATESAEIQTKLHDEMNDKDDTIAALNEEIQQLQIDQHLAHKPCLVCQTNQKGVPDTTTNGSSDIKSTERTMGCRASFSTPEDIPPIVPNDNESENELLTDEEVPSSINPSNSSHKIKLEFEDLSEDD